MPKKREKSAKRAMSAGVITFGPRASHLEIGFETRGWSLALSRTLKSDAARMAAGFNPYGNRDLKSLADGVDATPVDSQQDLDVGASPATLTGNTELGMQTDDDCEYFLSKFGDLVGVLRISRKEDGTWKAALNKSNLPRVLTPEAVEAGLMPPVGKSGLPSSLESVVPSEFHYWKADGDTARQMRDALVEQSFFNDDCIKAVDGELRKVDVRYFIYDPTGQTEKEFVPPTVSNRVEPVIPAHMMGKGFSPMADGPDDWVEELDKHDGPGTLAILSPTDRAIPAAQMARAASTLKGDYLLEHADTRGSRAAFGKLGPVFKIDGEPERIFCTSFAPASVQNVRFIKQGAVKVVDVQGVQIHIDRPKGFVQTGKDSNGVDWEREYQLDYGFLPNTQGGDGMELDVYVGPDTTSKRVFWVTQNKSDGAFDEFKVFVGFGSPRDARDAYTDHTPPQYYGGMSETSIDQLKCLSNVCPAEVIAGVAASSPISEAGTTIKIAKADGAPDEQYVLGIVLEPDVVDSQSDTYNSEEVRRASEKFMEMHRNMGLMHKMHVNDKVQILENYLAPVDMQIGDKVVKKGTWMMGVRVKCPELWQLVKDGALTGFSIGGTSIRTAIDAGAVQ